MRVLATLLVFILPNVAATQGYYVSLEKSRVFLTSGEIIIAEYGELTSNGFVGRSFDGERINLRIEEISKVQKDVGSKVFDGMAIGAAVGFIIVFAQIAMIETSSDKTVDSDKVLPAFISWGVLGGAIGAGIGGIASGWRTVPLPTSESAQTNTGISLSFSYRF